MASDMANVLTNVRQSLNLLFTPVLYYGVVASIALQLTTWEKGDRTQDKYQDQYQNQGDKFDFIIVGGGTAGSVLANRLSLNYNVLLLESGGEPNPLQFVPGLARTIVNHPQVDWMHMTVAQKKSCAFSKFRRASWPAGKTLGGSGSLDFLNYLRGNPEDFDNWARITRDSSWKYDNLLRYFQRSEDILGNSTDPGAHRHGGELRIQKSDFLPLGKEFLAAAKELGYKNVDLNGHFHEGFDYVYSTIKRGERQVPVKAFVDPVRKRKTLTIRKFALVTKVKMRPDKTAYAVEYERHGEKYLAYANREIILSAGTIGSPKILMLSGIGPKRHLEELGINPVMNLPVGQNLQDHVGTYLGPFFINEPLSLSKDRDITAESYMEYGTQGTGPLTFSGFSATGLISSIYSRGRGEELWPDLHLSLFPVSIDKSFSSDFAHTHGLNQDTLKKYYSHAVGKHSFHIFTSVARPAGRGEIRLASRNPQDPLVINPKYLEDPWDLDVKAAVDGIKTALRLVEGSTTFQNIGGRFTSEVIPGCESTKFRSEAYFECYIRHFTVSLYNPVGTCAMGPRDSIFAVVDPKLRVLGVKNLRVVDASIMPAIVSGGTSGPTIMIAEKAAELILTHWSRRVPQHQYENEKGLKQPPPVTLKDLRVPKLAFPGDSNSADSQQVAKVVKAPVGSKGGMDTAGILKGMSDFSEFLSKNVTRTLNSISAMVAPYASTRKPFTQTAGVNFNLMKQVRPASVSIKTSSSNPTPTPRSKPMTPTTTKSPFQSLLSTISMLSSLSNPSATPAPPTKFMSGYSVTPVPRSIATTPKPTTTTPPPLPTTEQLKFPQLFYGNGEPLQFSFPIFSSTTPSPTTQKMIKLRKIKPEKKAIETPMMQPTTIRPAPSPSTTPRNSINELLLEPFLNPQPHPTVPTAPTSTSTVESNNFQYSYYQQHPQPQYLQQQDPQPTLAPLEEFSTSTFSIQPAREINYNPSFSSSFDPTTYRPGDDQLVLLDPQSREMIPPKHLVSSEVVTEASIVPANGQQLMQSSFGGGGPIMYLVDNVQMPPKNVPVHQYHPIVANSPRFHNQQQQQQQQLIPAQHYQPPRIDPGNLSPHDPVPFQFNLQNDMMDLDEYLDPNSRFTRAQQQQQRYLEKPIKVHTHQHPAKVVRRWPKPTLSQSQTQIQQNIMASLKKFMPQRNHNNHNPPPPPPRALPLKQVRPDYIKPANIVYHGESASNARVDNNPLVAAGSDLVLGTRIFNTLREHQMRRQQEQQAHRRVETQETDQVFTQGFQ